MKTFICCVAVSMLCAGCATQGPERLSCQKISVYVPMDLSVEHTESTFEVTFDDFKLFAPTNITVDPGETAAVAYDVYFYRKGQPRPASPDWHGRHRDLDFGFAPCVYHMTDGDFQFVDGEIPFLPGREYVVEVDAAVVEAERGTLDDDNFGLPVSAMSRDGRFKILWKGHLEELVK